MTLLVNRRSVAKAQVTKARERTTGKRHFWNPRSAITTRRTAANVPVTKDTAQIRENAHIPETYRNHAITEISGPMLSAAASGGLENHTAPTIGNAHTEKTYQELGAPMSDISTSEPPPTRNSNPPTTRNDRRGAFNRMTRYSK